MSIINKRWVELRELPDAEKAEMSYIRLQNIERISFVEASKHEFRIFVSAFGEKYLYNIVETLEEAKSVSKMLIDEIEKSKASKG
ncbi:MAG: hypothetical protein ACU84H_01830 [Gammaproteobacteria bacterium]